MSRTLSDIGATGRIFNRISVSAPFLCRSNDNIQISSSSCDKIFAYVRLRFTACHVFSVYSQRYLFRSLSPPCDGALLLPRNNQMTWIARAGPNQSLPAHSTVATGACPEFLHRYLATHGTHLVISALALEIKFINLLGFTHYLWSPSDSEALIACYRSASQRML